jgi:hypothetical protein
LALQLPGARAGNCRELPVASGTVLGFVPRPFPPRRDASSDLGSDVEQLAMEMGDGRLDRGELAAGIRRAALEIRCSRRLEIRRAFDLPRHAAVVGQELGVAAPRAGRRNAVETVAAEAGKPTVGEERSAALLIQPAATEALDHVGDRLVVGRADEEDRRLAGGDRRLDPQARHHALDQRRLAGPRRALHRQHLSSPGRQDVLERLALRGREREAPLHLAEVMSGPEGLILRAEEGDARDLIEAREASQERRDGFRLQEVIVKRHQVSGNPLRRGLVEHVGLVERLVLRQGECLDLLADDALEKISREAPECRPIRRLLAGRLPGEEAVEGIDGAESQRALGQRLEQEARYPGGCAGRAREMPFTVDEGRNPQRVHLPR